MNIFLEIPTLNILQIVTDMSHIVSWAVFTSPQIHWFLLNKMVKIGENGGSRDNHAYNACKNQGVAQE